MASNLADAFNALLDAYQRIGEQIPLLLQYQALFQAYPHMRQLLVDIYQDILEFHREAIKHFQKSSKPWHRLPRSFGAFDLTKLSL